MKVRRGKCRNCERLAKRVAELEEFRSIQQVDLVNKLFKVTEHRARLRLPQRVPQVSA